MYDNHDATGPRTTVRSTVRANESVQASLNNRNYVVAKRFAKPQQMQWNSKSVHLLSQMRIRVLNGELEQTFKEWYPCFRVESKQ